MLIGEGMDGAQLAKLVNIGAITVADEIAIARSEGTVINERLFQRPAYISAQIESRLDVAQ